MTVTNEDFFKKRIGEIGFHHQSGHHDFIYFVVVKRSVSEVVGLDTFSEFGDHHIERKVVNLIKKIDDGSMSIFHVIEGLLTMLFNTSLQEGKKPLFANLGCRRNNCFKFSIELQRGRGITGVHEVLLNRR